MIQVGKINELQVCSQFPFGFQLRDPNAEDQFDEQMVTLLSSDAPAELKTGATVNVFVLPDETGALVAKTTPPAILAGQTKVLRAVNATHFGAFFDWGLDKDLLVPTQYQEASIDPGRYYVVHVFYDKKTQRILGATRLHYFLEEHNDDLAPKQNVSALVYAKTELGFKVVIDERFTGVIFHSDAFKPLRIGEQVDAFVKEIREDGKLNIALQRTDKVGRSNLEEAIIEDLEAHGGISTLTDKAQPDEIYSRFQVSKAAYKKALGALYKQRKIVIDKQAVRLNSNKG